MKKYTLLIIIMTFFFLINLHTLFNRDIFVDEAISFKIANEVPIKEILSGIDVHPIIFPLLTKILPHKNFYLGRIFSLIIMTLSLFLLFYTINKIFNIKLAYVILILSSFLPPFVSSSHTFEYSLS